MNCSTPDESPGESGQRRRCSFLRERLLTLESPAWESLGIRHSCGHYWRS
jgi:hypothetical protein